jgi:stage IV sporulation protein FB
MFWLVLIMLSGRLNMTGKVGEVLSLLSWLLAGTISIIWHELGHAFFQRKYGGYPEIVLHQMGGYSATRGAYYTRWQSLTISVMGPLFGLMLYGLFWVLKKFTDIDIQSLGMNTFFRDMLFINLVWSIFNLLPIYPLDGGQAFMALSNGKAKMVGLVGMIVAGICAFFAISSGSIWNTLLCGYLAYQNFLMWKEPYHRPDFF